MGKNQAWFLLLTFRPRSYVYKPISCHCSSYTYSCQHKNDWGLQGRIVFILSVNELLQSSGRYPRQTEFEVSHQKPQYMADYNFRDGVRQRWVKDYWCFFFFDHGARSTPEKKKTDCHNLNHRPSHSGQVCRPLTFWMSMLFIMPCSNLEHSCS